MNGLPTQVYLWLLAGAGAVIAAGAAYIGFLISLIVRDHVKNDEAFQTRVLKALEGFEERLHRYGNRVNEIATRLRWADEDKSKGDKP